MKAFKRLDKVELKVRHEYMKEGRFVVEINRLKESETKDGREIFVLEGTVLESSNPETPVGALVQFLETFKFPEKGDMRVKQLLAAANDGNDVNQKTAEAAVSEDQPFAGKKIRIVTELKSTKNGGTFTEHFFYPVK